MFFYVIQISRTPHKNQFYRKRQKIWVNGQSFVKHSNEWTWTWLHLVLPGLLQCIVEQSISLDIPWFGIHRTHDSDIIVFYSFSITCGLVGSSEFSNSLGLVAPGSKTFTWGDPSVHPLGCLTACCSMTLALAVQDTSASVVSKKELKRFWWENRGAMRKHTGGKCCQHVCQFSKQLKQRSSWKMYWRGNLSSKCLVMSFYSWIKCSPLNRIHRNLEKLKESFDIVA